MAKRTQRVPTNWEIDAWYAVILVLLVGVIAKIAGMTIANTLLSSITAGLITVLITGAMIGLMKMIIKRIFNDERELVLSTLPDVLLCCAIIIFIGVIFRDTIGENYLVVIVASCLSMIASYVKLGQKFKDWILLKLKRQ